MDDEDLKSALRFIRDAGLVPTGKGPRTKPSKTPPFFIVCEGETYLLVTETGLGGESWRITADGAHDYQGTYVGTYPTGGNEVYTDARFVDYVPELAVIQAVYGLLDPDFDDEDDHQRKTKH